MDYILWILILLSLSLSLPLLVFATRSIVGIEEHILNIPNGVASLLVVTLNGQTAHTKGCLENRCGRLKPRKNRK